MWEEGKWKLSSKICSSLHIGGTSGDSAAYLSDLVWRESKAPTLATTFVRRGVMMGWMEMGNLRMNLLFLFLFLLFFITLHRNYITGVSGFCLIRYKYFPDFQVVKNSRVVEAYQHNSHVYVSLDICKLV